MSGVRVFADGSDDEFFDVHDDAENDVTSVRPNNFLGSLKRRPKPKSKRSALPPKPHRGIKPRRGSALRHRSERDDEFVTSDNPEGWVSIVERRSAPHPDPTGAEVLANFCYCSPTLRAAEYEAVKDVEKFMKDGQWPGLYAYLKQGHPEIDDASFNESLIAQLRTMVENGLAEIPLEFERKHKPWMAAGVYGLLGYQIPGLWPPGYKILGLKQLPPADGSLADRQARLRAAVQANPNLSVRELARQEGTSKSTIHRLRKRLDEGVPL
jgi:hypothetical protein